jgi:hypothetical protein
MSAPSSIPPAKSFLPTFFWGILGFALFGALCVLLLRTAGNFETEEGKNAQKRLETRLALEKEDQKRLTSYGWVDKNKGVVHIPAEQAATLELPALKNKPVKAGPAIPPPPPAPAPAPATAPNN